jgi:hypothetical protein
MSLVCGLDIRWRDPAPAKINGKPCANSARGIKAQKLGIPQSFDVASALHKALFT